SPRRAVATRRQPQPPSDPAMLAWNSLCVRSSCQTSILDSGFGIKLLIDVSEALIGRSNRPIIRMNRRSGRQSCDQRLEDRHKGPRGGRILIFTACDEADVTEDARWADGHGDDLGTGNQ